MLQSVVLLDDGTCWLRTEWADCENRPVVCRLQMVVAGVTNSAESSLLNGHMWGIGLFWLAVTDCKLNLMCVLDGALQEELAVHRLTGRLCGCHYDRGLMNGGEWPLRTTSKLDRGLCPGVCLPHITCLVWQTDTPLELWLPVTSQSGCHGYHVVLRQCVLCAVRAEAVKTLLNVESRCSGRRVGCDCRRGWAWQFSLLWK